MHSRRIRLDVLLVSLAVVMYGTGLTLLLHETGCARVPAKAGQPGRQGTPFEQLLVWNASLADSNLAVAKAVIVATEANEIEVPLANKILTQQSLIADADRQLTFVLSKACIKDASAKQSCNPALLSADSIQIKGFLDQIQMAAKNLIASGTAGIKNRQRAADLQKDAQTMGTLADQILATLKSIGVLK